MAFDHALLKLFRNNNLGGAVNEVVCHLMELHLLPTLV
jgi:hypothetical protein